VLSALRQRSSRAALGLSLALAVAALGACGGGDDPADESLSADAPAADSFPAADGRSLEDILAEGKTTNDTVVAPGGLVYDTGKQRVSFAVFTADRSQITDAEVALYAAPGAGGKATGPYPAEIEDLATDPAFEARTTANDPDAGKAVYVTDIDFDKPGEWRLVALIRDGDGYLAARVPSLDVGGFEQIPDVGDKAPVIHTPTVAEAGDIASIDTRDPHDTMHDIDAADVIGQKPTVLLFATPALCVSRVCGPVVDVAEQVKSEVGDDVAFIHMEVYNDNDPNAGIRPQLRDYGLRSEPWLFVIDSDGKVTTRIEGAFSVDELREAVDEVTG
jgi:hypothetical protein